MGRKVLFWVKNSVSWAKSGLLHGTNMRLTKTFVVIFALAEWLPTSATLVVPLCTETEKKFTPNRGLARTKPFFILGCQKRLLSVGW